MIPSFPDPYPDELFYSLCARFTDRLDYQSDNAVLRDLFGLIELSAQVDLPNHLEDFVARLQPGHALSVDRLIDDHTLLPFYGWFVPAPRLGRLRHYMRGAKRTATYLAAGLARSNKARASHFRFCLLCVEEDRQHFGECYWHRIHQVSEVVVCPVHSVPLEPSSVPLWHRVNRKQFISAERAIPKKLSSASSSTIACEQILLHIAQNAAWLLTRCTFNPDLDSLYSHYEIALSNMGLTTHSGRALPSAIEREFGRRYSSRTLKLLHCELGTTKKKTWITHLFQQRERLHPPLYHLLLVHFLGYRLEELLGLRCERKPFGQGPWPCLNFASDHHRQPTIEECHVTIQRSGPLLGTFACSCGFVYTRKGPDHSLENRYRRHDIKSVGHVWEGRLRQLWSDPTISLEGMGKQLGVATDTVKRHGARLGLTFPPAGSRAFRPVKITEPNSKGHPSAPARRSKYRRAWIQAVRDNPGEGKWAISRKIPRIYDWLIRHDNKWLKANSPAVARRARRSVSQIDWQDRDARLAQDVAESAKKFLSSSRPSDSYYKICNCAQNR